MWLCEQTSYVCLCHHLDQKSLFYAFNITLSLYLDYVLCNYYREIQYEFKKSVLTSILTNGIQSKVENSRTPHPYAFPFPWPKFSHSGAVPGTHQSLIYITSVQFWFSVRSGTLRFSPWTTTDLTPFLWKNILFNSGRKIIAEVTYVFLLNKFCLEFMSYWRSKY